MARPSKLKKVCSMPKFNTFVANGAAKGEIEKIGVEEYEAIRLIDYRGFNQEEAAEKMHIARTTLQAIYERARKSVAKVIVCGGTLVIEGGNYHLCDGLEESCDCGGCEKHRNYLKEKKE